MKFQIVIISLIFLFLCCKKKENPVQAEEEVPKIPEQPKTYENYSALKVGNYWVYNKVQIEVSGAEKVFGKDSIVVEKDTLIRGRTFYKLLTYMDQYTRPYYRPEYYSDSLHYIISPDKIVFSSEDTTTLFHLSYWVNPNASEDTIMKITQKMTEMNVMTTVPAGTFKTCTSQTWYAYVPKYTSPTIKNPRFENRKYAKGIGIVMGRLAPWANYDFEQEMRLIRYKVN